MLPPLRFISWLNVFFVESRCTAYTYHVGLPVPSPILDDEDLHVWIEICKALYHGLILVPSASFLKAAYPMWKGDAFWSIMQL